MKERKRSKESWNFWILNFILSSSGLLTNQYVLKTCNYKRKRKKKERFLDSNSKRKIFTKMYTSIFFVNLALDAH